MAIITSGKNWKGEECEYHMDDNLLKNLDVVKDVVSKKDFDYVCIVAGLPGSGKSNFAINCCKYLDKDFTELNIASDAEKFIEITNNCKPRSAVMLDESFASLNSKVGMSTEFLRIINHLQIIRQKNLYIFLCLPNFFDLSKGISIYRTSHLFVCYGTHFGDRGSFAAWGREEKKMLYINGLKYMNYFARDPNFRGRFVKQKAINEDAYNKIKTDHLKDQEKKKFQKTTRIHIQRDKLLYLLRTEFKVSVPKLSKLIEIPERTIYDSIAKQKEKNE